MKLDDTITAIVTGGASGLGETTARRLASHGVKVTIFDLNEERGAAVAADIGGRFESVDVTDIESVETGFTAARAAHGPARILVNCAGIAPPMKTVSRHRETGDVRMHDLALFAKIIAINLTGTFNCIAYAAAEMVDCEPLNADGEKGLIINTASVAAEDGQIGQVAYAASKGGVKSLTLPVARDLAREGVRVNTILPGLFHTPLFDALPPAAVESLSASVPFPSRLGLPDEYAALAIHMAENAMLNAATIRLDGAIRLAPK
ncbi:SDR family NAD(P)-dependent oxidoreductase [Ahrensia sp. R2A130]|uniref:SDR family NAD(P)-dependent oxidoreductase n=1 Tax=Ahrensia sp. R2A130 TaxID=744979 RepID=UPI0001E09C4E|nr:SDR family NAD(P)-dependent oxidoreductase [Ahrensia sp. R2A130]EFL89632.1 3-hydroxyacyl-CoA dehydrogenase type-2 [Ahrensia sp. R2A130]